MPEGDILFRIEADESGAVRGIVVSRKELDKLNKAAKKTGQEAKKSTKDMKGFGDATAKTGRQAAGTSKSVQSLQRAVLALFTVVVLKRVIAYADTMKNLDARLKIVTNSEAALNRARAETFAISQRTSASIESTIELYGRLELSLKGTNIAQEDILKVTETINQAMVASGASFQEANAAVIQLSQGLAAGALRGDEFRSVAEQSPRILQALQASLGKTRGELKELADQGRLTTEVITAALLEQGEAIAEEYANIPITVGRAMQQLDNQVARSIGLLDEATGATALLAAGIVLLAENFDPILKASILASLGLLTGGSGAVLAFMNDWITFTDDQTASMSELAEAIASATTELALMDAVMKAIIARDLAEFDLAVLESGLNDALDRATQAAKVPGLEGVVAGEIESAKALEAQIISLAREIDVYNEVIAEGEERTKALGAAKGEAKKTALELLEATNGLADAEKKYSDALKIAEKAVLKGGTVQQKIDLLTKQYTQTMRLLREQLSGSVEDLELLEAALDSLETELEDGIQVLLDESDGTIQYVCGNSKCGHIAMIDRRGMLRCPVCGENGNIHPIQTSYAFKLLLDELMSLGVVMRLQLEDMK